MSGNPEVDKAVNQLEAQRPPIEDAASVVDNAVGVYEGKAKDWTNEPPQSTDPEQVDGPDDEQPAEKPAKKAAKKASAKKTSSGNRAEKQDSKEE